MRIEFLSSSLAALLFVGCQPATPDVKSTDTPVAFELRDFQVKQTSSTSYDGRGTLLTKDAALQKGVFIVFLTAKVSGKRIRDDKLALLLKDGIGTVETHDYVLKGEGGVPEYTDWAVTGYVPLRPGTITTK